jgi:uncharacterized NAD-dependent epimerase/dehydratase family protein
MKMPTVQSEIDLIENFSKAEVIAITINHENMLDEELTNTISEYEDELKLPTTDVLKSGCDKLIAAIFEKYPKLKSKHNKVFAK